MSVVLIGYRGSGKTTVGRMLAERVRRPFVDSDDWIVRRAGKPIRDIFAHEGESAFREMEKAVVSELALLNGHIIALGGGALGREENRAAIAAAGHRIVYLRCHPQELLRRIQGDPATATARPALSNLGGGIEEIESILAQREPLWRTVSADEVDVSDLTPQQVTDAIARLI